MAEKPMNNFKTAVNELMNGKIRTDDEPLFKEPSAPAEPAAAVPTPVPSSAPTFNIEPPSFMTAAPTTAASDSVTVLASDIIIEGSVKSKSDLRLNGYIKGDVSCGGSIVSTGTIDGNIEGSNITLSGSTITGNINVRGSLSIDSNSAVTGDITGASLVSDGKVKGNIILKDGIVLQANATVMGNVKAKSITIESGTTLVGNIEIKAGGSSQGAFAPAAEPSPVAANLANILEEKVEKKAEAPTAPAKTEEKKAPADEEPEIKVFSPSTDKGLS